MLSLVRRQWRRLALYWILLSAFMRNQLGMGLEYQSDASERVSIWVTQAKIFIVQPAAIAAIAAMVAVVAVVAVAAVVMQGSL